MVEIAYWVVLIAAIVGAVSLCGVMAYIWLRPQLHRFKSNLKHFVPPMPSTSTQRSVVQPSAQRTTIARPAPSSAPVAGIAPRHEPKPTSVMMEPILTDEPDANERALMEEIAKAARQAIESAQGDPEQKEIAFISSEEEPKSWDEAVKSSFARRVRQTVMQTSDKPK